MTSSPKGSALIRSGSSGVDALHPADRHTNRGFDPGRSQPGGSSEVTTLDRADQSLSVTAKEPPRILVVDAALALQDSHVLLLRSIPNQEKQPRRHILFVAGGALQESSCSKTRPRRSTTGFMTSGSTLVCIRRQCARR